MNKQIKDYIKYLKTEHNYNISVHSYKNALDGAVQDLTPYNIHANNYCLFVKNCAKGWEKCIQQQVIVNMNSKDEPFFGSCFAGVGEFVFPVVNDNTVLGFVSVSGYCGSTEKRDHFAEKYNLNKKKLTELYEKHLCCDIPDLTRVKTLISPLVSMLVLSSMKSKKTNTSQMADYIYSHIVSIIDSSYAENLTIESLAEACHCSISHISHLFKKKSGITIFQYLTKVRLKHARNLLKNTDLLISEISGKTGFSDPNYFSYVFSKEEGISPRVYRKKQK